MNFIIVFLILSILLTCLCTFLLDNKNTYCFIFEHEDWKRWRYYLKHASEFKYVQSFPDWCYEFSFEDDMYRSEVIILWEKTKTCSIHYQNDDCLMDFDPQSKQMYKKLIKQITY